MLDDTGSTRYKAISVEGVKLATLKVVSADKRRFLLADSPSVFVFGFWVSTQVAFDRIHNPFKQ